MQRTLLIGLDGASFTILDRLMADGTMPFLRRFIDGGVRAELRSTLTPLTPPAWTSLITGRSPGHHGIFDFIWAEQRAKDHYFTLYNFRDICCETVWAMVGRMGGTAWTLNFPMMAPPPRIAGFVVPGLVSWKHLRLNVHPPELYAELKALPGFDPRSIAWDFDLEKKAERGIPPEEYANWIRFHVSRERKWFDVARHMLRAHPCDLMAVLFDGPDKLMHMGWRLLDPAGAALLEEDRRLADMCREYFRELDGFLAELVAQAGPDARVFLASDHGFGPSTFALRINTWLAEHGYLAWRRLEDVADGGRESAQRLVDRHFVLLDWDRTLAYARTSTSNGVFIRVAAGPGQPGVPASEYAAFRERLAARIRGIADPRTGEPVVREVLTREEAFPGPRNAQAPDLTLVLKDHGFVSILDRQPVVCQRAAVEGTHYPDGVFAAYGPGIRPGAILPRLSILDVAPALLYSLGLPVPSDLEGTVPSAFTEAMLRDAPPRRGAPTRPPEAPGPGDAEKSGGEDGEAQVYKQLKALGYVE